MFTQNEIDSWARQKILCKRNSTKKLQREARGRIRPCIWSKCDRFAVQSWTDVSSCHIVASGHPTFEGALQDSGDRDRVCLELHDP